MKEQKYVTKILKLHPKNKITLPHKLKKNMIKYINIYKILTWPINTDT